MSERQIVVTGVGKVLAKPDLITISMNLETSRPTYEEAMNDATKELDSLSGALVSTGFNRNNLRTTFFNIDTEYESYRDKKNNQKSRFIGYKCNHMLELEFNYDNNLELLNKALQAIVSSDAHPRFGIIFSVKDKETMKRKMLQKAIIDSTEKARVLAEASGIALGNIVRIDYSWGEIELTTRSHIRLCDPAAPAVMLRRLEVEPEDVESSDTVTIVWEIVN